MDEAATNEDDAQSTSTVRPTQTWKGKGKASDELIWQEEGPSQAAQANPAVCMTLPTNPVASHLQEPGCADARFPEDRYGGQAHRKPLGCIIAVGLVSNPLSPASRASIRALQSHHI